MKYSSIAMWLWVSTTFWPLSAIGQAGTLEVFAAAGEEFSNGSVRLGWTIGETVIATFQDDNSALTQGFHQPNLLATATHHPTVAAHLQVFPNPASDHVWMIVEGQSCRPRTYSIRNELGQELRSALVHGQGQAPMRLDLPGTAPGLYLLIMDGECGRVVRPFTVLAQ